MIRGLPKWLALSLVFILIVGAVFTWWTVVEKDGQMRQQLLTETRLGATGIRIENVVALTGSGADLNSQDYHLLKENLIQIRLANPKIRFVYLTGQRPDGEVFFFADSEPPESEDYSPPGEVYTEVSDTFRQVFRTTLQTTEGPVSDRWGIWVSGFVPLTNPKTGTLVAVLGMDVDARDWNRELIAAATVPVLVTGVIASILVLFFILQQRTQRENRRLAASEAALQKSEEKYRLIADNTADNIWIFDLDLNLKYISPSVKRMRGFTVEEAMWQTLEQMMTPESRESFLKCFHEELALEASGTADPERTVSLETMAFCKDGSTILMESTIRFLRDTDHQPIGIIGISRDITERKRAEKALQIQHNLALALTTCHTMNEALELILDVTLQAEGLDSGGIYIADPVTAALDIAVHRGLSPEFVKHTSHFNADAPQVKRAKTGTPFYGRYGDIRPVGKDEIRDREGLTALASIPVLHDSNLIAIVNMASHVRDDIPVHTRKLLETLAVQIGGALAYIRSEEALYKSESHLSDIINFLPDAMFAVDENGTVIVWNQAIEKITGVPAEQILGKGNYEYALPFYHERRPVLVDLIRNNDPVTAKRYPNLQRIGNTFMAETFIPHFNNGKGAHIRCTASALYGQVGKPKGAIEIIRDITEHKRAEEALRESEIRYREFFTTSRDCVFITSPDGRFIDFNDATLEMFGYDNREEMSKVPIPALYAHSEDRSVFLNLIVRDGYVKEFQVQLKQRDGTVIDSLITSVPLRNPDGTIKAFIGSARDITERKRAVEALNESERRFRELSNLLPQIVYETDAAGILTYANRIAFEWFGYTEDEFRQGLNVQQMLAPHNQERGGAAFRAMLEGKGRIGIPDEYIALRKDGGTFPISIYSSPIIAHGRISGLRGIIIDNTECKRAEDKLLFTRHSVDSAIDTMVTVAQDGHFVDVNDSFCRKSGYSRDELLSMTVHDLDPDYYREIWPAFWNKLKQSGSLIFETTHRTKEGRIYPVEITATYFEYNGNEYHCAFARDITERKRAEELLRESEERYRTLAEESPDQIFIVGRDDTMKYANTAALKLFRRSYDQVIGTPRKDLFPSEIIDAQSNLLKKIFETGEQIRTEEKIQFGTREFWIDTNLVPLKDKEKNVTSVLGIARDITERKAAEETLKKFVDDLDRQVIQRTSDLSDVNLKLVTEIGIRVDAEKQLTKAVGEKEVLLREVHHRVKNNLQIIISLLNLQSRYMTDEATLGAFWESQNRIKAMALVHEKLYQSDDIAKIDLDNYLKFLANNLFSFFGMKGKGITITMDVRDISVAIDTAIPLGLIINELISNSLKYAFPNGRKGEISLVIHRQDHTLTILFRDNGVGIPADFDWHNAKSLGLRLVIGLVEQLQGTIELDRTAGTTFTIVVKEK